MNGQKRGAASNKAGTGLLLIGIWPFLLVAGSAAMLVDAAVGIIISTVTIVLIRIGFIHAIVWWGSDTGRQKKFLVAGIIVYYSIGDKLG